MNTRAPRIRRTTDAVLPTLVSFLCFLWIDIASAKDKAAPYDGWQRYSQYVEVRDGTKLAVDYYRPTRNGELHESPLPTLWRHTAYHRYKLDAAGQIPESTAQNLPDGAETLLANGYVVAVADIRGMGASYGSQVNWMGTQQTRDAYDLMEWLASQPWSDGNLGMFGRSYLGTAQYFAAAAGSKHLKAIFPEMAGFDNYNIFYTNGIYRADMPALWRLTTAQLNYSLPLNQVRPFSPPSLPPMGVAPVNADPNGVLLLGAVREHFLNRDLIDLLVPLPFRDDTDAQSQLQVHLDDSPWTLLDEIEASGVAIYHMAGWYDAYAKDTLMFFVNLDNPQKVLLGPWHHINSFGVDLPAERLRWFDYWLKGIDNGIMNEPAMRYFVPGAASGNDWRSSNEWPLKEESRTNYFLSAASGAGVLAEDKPVTRIGQDEYLVDPDISLGTYVARNMGNNPACLQNPPLDPNCGQRAEYPDLRDYDAKGLTYTSEPLQSDVQMTGHPVIHLWATANNSDADFFVVLEEVHSDGFSQYLADGAMRASHRTLNEPPFNHLGMPWPGNLRDDASPLPDEPVKLSFDLRPISNVFEKGHRIRVTITGAEASFGPTTLPGNAAQRTLTIYRDSERSSYVELPIINTDKPVEVDAEPELH